jgi:hypothetical protein
VGFDLIVDLDMNFNDFHFMMNSKHNISNMLKTQQNVEINKTQNQKTLHQFALNIHKLDTFRIKMHLEMDTQIVPPYFE